MEVWLTSEDLGAYGHDIGVTLPDLLWQLVAVIPDNCMLRLGMTNPPYILQHMEVGVWLGVELEVWQPLCITILKMLEYKWFHEDGLSEREKSK